MKFFWYYLFMCMVFTVSLYGQSRNSTWVFGDNAGIDFTVPTNPMSITSNVISRGSCANICNTAGQLLFYTAPDTDVFSTGYIMNGEINRPDGSIMPNGDSLVGLGWYYEMLIVPFPNDTNKYYVFAIGVTTSYGLWYHVVDMQQDSGKGDVMQKNIQLLNFAMIDGLSAIKHGNGRDWWIICRKSTYAQGTSNNTWYSYLITPTGIGNSTLQNVGSLNSTNNAVFCFNPEGDKICFINAISMIELYDFDRCSGVISNPINIEPEVTVLPYPFYWGCEFSPSGQYLYVTSQMNPVSSLWQFDLWASNIAASKTLIWQVSYPPYTAGALKRGPDNKIYMSCGWVDSSGNYTFPYDSTMYYPENMNLGVINSPDSQGATCDFQPWSFYLGGKRTYWGLPNNPDYDLGRDSGSVCDTIQWTGSPPAPEGGEGSKLFVTYITSWQKLFVNAQNIKGKNAVLRIYDLNGRVVFKSSSGSGSGGYFTEDVDVRGLSSGMYVVSLITDKEVLVKKFIKQ